MRRHTRGVRTVGVEEEYLLVGPDGVPVAVAGAVIRSAPPSDDDEPGGDLEAELKEQQLETGTRPCTDLAELGREIREGRVRADSAARRAGARVAALGTSPLAVASTVTPRPRYRAIHREFALTAREQLTCGCHVHVGIADEEEGVAVLDRIRPWLPVLLALSVNSPFWLGEDSGYASYRTQVWHRWPTAGPTAPFGSAAGYRAAVDALVSSGAILDEGMVYFDARLSARYPTVEVRVGDVCLDADDALLLAALTRALVETAAREAASGRPPVAARAELLRAASWRAARSGLGGDLVHPVTGRPAPADAVVTALLAHVGPVLAEDGDLPLVRDLLAALHARGTGADRQRAVLAGGGDAAAVVDAAVKATLA